MTSSNKKHNIRFKLSDPPPPRSASRERHSDDETNSLLLDLDASQGHPDDRAHPDLESESTTPLVDDVFLTSDDVMATSVTSAQRVGDVMGEVQQHQAKARSWHCVAREISPRKLLRNFLTSAFTHRTRSDAADARDVTQLREARKTHNLCSAPAASDDVTSLRAPVVVTQSARCDGIESRARIGGKSIDVELDFMDAQ